MHIESGFRLVNSYNSFFEQSNESNIKYMVQMEEENRFADLHITKMWLKSYDVANSVNNKKK